MKSCDECGAEVPDGGTCRDHFDELLAREWQIPGGPIELAHFFAVASYGLQHPASMNYTVEALAWLHDAVADVLEGRVTVKELRRHGRAGAPVAEHVTRREGEQPSRWDVSQWPMSITDVLTTAPDMNAYLEVVSRWASSVVQTLRHHAT